MSRCKTIALGTIFAFTLFSPLLVSPDRAEAGLLTQLRQARHELSSSRSAVAAARAAFRQARMQVQGRGKGPTGLKLARPTGLKLAKARERARALERTVQRLAAAYHRQQSVASAARRGDWMPLIRQVAASEHISATGLYKMMKLESGGRASATNGSFHGLFQYSSTTWRGSWNPWRDASIWNGEAQIRATARAIHRGWGRSMWPNTYPAAF